MPLSPRVVNVDPFPESVATALWTERTHDKSTLMFPASFASSAHGTRISSEAVEQPGMCFWNPILEERQMPVTS